MGSVKIIGEICNRRREMGDKFRNIRLHAPVLMKSSSSEKILVLLYWLLGSRPDKIRVRRLFRLKFGELILVERKKLY